MSAPALLAKILVQCCEERDLNDTYAKKIIAGDFNFDRATPENVARLFCEADRVSSLCSDANALDIDLSGAQVVFLYNPFPQEVKEVMKQRLREVAVQEPLIVVDYQGLFLATAPEFRRMDRDRNNPFQIYGSRQLHDRVLDRVGYVLPPK